ncbi:hypothetical protein J3F83DRAFT_259630 [Trichoderma novae-zelandiae]
MAGPSAGKARVGRIFVYGLVACEAGDLAPRLSDRRATMQFRGVYRWGGNRDELIRLEVDLYQGHIDRLTDEKWDAGRSHERGRTRNAVQTTKHSPGMQRRRLRASPMSKRPSGAVSWRGRPLGREPIGWNLVLCKRSHLHSSGQLADKREKRLSIISCTHRCLGTRFLGSQWDTQARIPASSTSAPEDKGGGGFVQRQTASKRQAERPPFHRIDKGASITRCRRASEDGRLQCRASPKALLSDTMIAPRRYCWDVHLKAA